jgi:hypothetical protein
MALDAQHAALEDGEQADRACADDDDVCLESLACHWIAVPNRQL